MASVGPGMRLPRWLAHCGVGSRRHCEELVRAGRVRVDGRVVTDPACRVVPGESRVEVDGRPVQGGEPLVYVLLHKPRGLLSAASDPRRRPTVVDHVRQGGGPPVRLYPVGRLDLDSEGLLLLTNDGELAFALTHPSREVGKTYRVMVAGAVDRQALRRLERGVLLEDGLTAPARVRVVRRGERSSVLELTVHEGRKRQVRRMCRAVGHPVLRLVRVRLGPLRLGRLRPGQWRYLRPDEVKALRRAARLEAGAPAGQPSGPFTPPGESGILRPKVSPPARARGRQDGRGLLPAGGAQR